MIGQFPWDPFPPGTPLPKGPDPIPALAYEAAMRAADSYRGVRDALRIEENVLRIGNRFVPVTRYRSVSFVAAGAASGSMALAAHHALGDLLNQGFTAGPVPSPEEVPYLHLTVPLGLPGDSAGEPAAGAALEVAEGVAPNDLLLVLLSPGALAALAAPPAGMTADEFRRLLAEAQAAGATGVEVERIARLIGRGAVGGRLAAAARSADVATLVVERGDGARLLGGGPTLAGRPDERADVRALLDRLGLRSRLPPPVLASLGEPPAEAGPARHRPVRVAGPNDALRAAGDAIFEKKWRSRLAMLQVPGGPEEAADAFLQRFEELALREPELATDRSPGLGVFAMTGLGQPEGVDDGPALARFLARCESQRRRRNMSVALLRTAGGLGSKEYPAGAVIGPPTDPDVSVPAGHARALPMQIGVTDVGCVVLALLPAVRVP